jgi:hypothetical protein
VIMMMCIRIRLRCFGRRKWAVKECWWLSDVCYERKGEESEQRRVVSSFS